MWLPQPPRRTAMLPRVAVRFEAVRSAEPPRSSGSSACKASIAFCEALREAMLAACATVAASSRRLASDQCPGSARLREGRLDGRGVVAGDLAYDTPAVGLKAPRGVIGEPMLDAAVDADAVVVVDRHQFRQPQCSGERARFVADAFHQTTVTHEYPRSVVDDRVARPIEFRGQELLGERHADRIGQPLPEWAGGGFHPGRDSDLRTAGSLAVQLTKALQFFQRQGITGEVQQSIQQDRKS